MIVTPAGPATASDAGAAPARGNSELGKDQFLQLLVAQLRNQDPLNPSDPREFASQLAQFSSLEQMVNIGSQLAQMNETDSAMIELVNANSALSLLGKDVLAASDEIIVPEDGATSITFDVAKSGGTATLKLLDENGRTVATRTLGSVDGGRQTVAIDDVPPGRHRYVVEVRDADGGEVGTITYTRARVNGIEYTSEGPVLICGELRLPLGAVVKVDNP